MKPTRRAQPYRKGPRMPGPSLSAMLRGRTLYGVNPQDIRRRTARKGGLRSLLAHRRRQTQRRVRI